MKTQEIPTKQEIAYVPSLDGFRGLAVLWIVLHHCWGALTSQDPNEGPLANVLGTGFIGLDVLFLVSGFVLFLPVVLDEGEFGDARVYGRRRAARIVPAFWAALLVSYPIAKILGEAKGGAGAWLSHLFFVHQYAHPRGDIGFGVDRAMWTMTIEVTFYVLLAFAATRYFRHPLIGLAVAVCVGEAWHLATANLDVVLHWTGIAWAGTADAQLRMADAFPSYLPRFAAGMTAAWLFVRVRQGRFGRVSPKLVSAAASAALVGFVAFVILRARGHVGFGGALDDRMLTLGRTLSVGLLVLITALASERAQWPVSNNLSRLLGSASYGIYLSHMLVIPLLRRAFGMGHEMTGMGDLVLLSASTVFVSLGLGVVSYEYLEQPFRRWARGRRQSAPRISRGRAAVLAGSPT